MQPRDRAYRRSQRDRVLHAREERLPLTEVNLPRRLWRLYSPEGTPLPVFYREDSVQFNTGYRHENFEKEPHLASFLLSQESLWAMPGPKKVRLRHYGECHLAKPYVKTTLVRDSETKYHYEREVYKPSGPCTCQWKEPSWPGSQPGFEWRCVKVYLPDARPYVRGRLESLKLPKQSFRFRRATGIRGKYVSRGEKNWKLLYTRSVKVLRAWKLGFVYHAIDSE